MNEADTCTKYVVPKLVSAGWDAAPHSFTEQRTFTDGRVFVKPDAKTRRGEKKRVDYLLRYTRDFPIAVVEAKAKFKHPADGLQQARDYAEALGLRFAYSTNGQGIVEFDFATGSESELADFPTPGSLLSRIKQADGLDDHKAQQLLEGSYIQPKKVPRYYQEIAINRVVQNLVQGRDRVLVTMATGTGKTVVAFQVCWKLWNAKWNRRGKANERPRILFLADRDILVSDPLTKDFFPFGDACHRIQGEAITSRQMYFATYQAIAADERRPGLYKEYAPDFFDLIIIDECHRGSSRSDSNWREILDYFTGAAKFGMTATPLRDDSRDTYEYFGNPLYTYSLRQGIEDGFLAPYRVHRVVTTADATGWRPSKGELDRFGREIPDDEYQTKDFERVVALRSRTQAIAKHLFGFLQKNNPMAKTLVFCVDQEHAQEMRSELQKLLAKHDPERAKQYPNYVVRVTADEGQIGRGHLSRFQELETEEPVILTSSQLLTTGVDAKMVKIVALARVVGSMSEFKQIIGRGTRIDEDYGKLWFSILDYTGTATSHFADPDFDGEPELVEEITIDGEGEEVLVDPVDPGDGGDPDGTEEDPPPGGTTIIDDSSGGGEPRKFYIDRDAGVGIAHEVTQDLTADGKLLTVTEFIDYTAGRVRSLCRDPDDLLDRWLDGHRRQEIIAELQSRGIDFTDLEEAAGHRDADPFDLLCHIAFNAPLRTRRERAERVRKEKSDFFAQYGEEAKGVLLEILLKYEDHGAGQFEVPDVLKVPPISDRGNVREIIQLFGGADRLRAAVIQLQNQLYVA
ncbi:EcoAI/FtnUII family type I restriction enzme subunit R [Botrimarina hoheduenensis]|uniref:Type-1 restriction enzyme R protein n=1 Tax=Botrimarina hoheduenensis TaxID=2528000 RepID=A0A5C5VTB0_9BACT|nr:DEAD/DEAH box helicase family protein [Botrimarina hoheduenensis]TWT41367.1 Type-1 restriction enzyme R protein [Botrimarina hoheduenensis]